MVVSGSPLGDHDVQQHVDRIGAALRGDVGDAAAVGQLDEVPLHHPGQPLAARGLESGVHPLAHRGIGERGATLGVGERDHLAPAGHGLEHPAAAESHHVGQRQRDHLGAAFGGVIRRRELLREHRRGRRAPEQVPVERTVGRERHPGHELDALVGDLAHRRG